MPLTKSGKKFFMIGGKVKRILVLLFVLFLAIPVYAYRIDNVISEPPTSVSSNVVILETAGTAEVLGSGTGHCSITIVNTSSVDIVYVGGEDVSSGNGYPIQPINATTGNSVTFDIDSIGDIYAVGIGANDTISYLLLKR